jgi:CRISPR-associated protein Csb2
VSSAPNNDDDVAMRAAAAGVPTSVIEKARRERFTGLDVWRRVVTEPVTYCWQLSEKDVEQARTVADMAHDLYRLGRGEDFAWAVADIERTGSAPVASTWQPTAVLSPGAASLRVPVPGSLDSLVERERARAQRIAQRDYVDRAVRFEEVTYARGGPSQSRLFRLYELRSPDGRRLVSWPQHDAITVAAMLRHALAQGHQRSDPGLRGFAVGHPVAGRPASERLSWLPLPSLGHMHVDGRIRRLMVVAPPETAKDTFERAVYGLHFATLLRDSRPAAMVVETDEIGGAVQPYVATSRAWASVTPVILPGAVTRGRSQPGRFIPKKAVALIRKALEREGFPEPLDLSFQPAPFFPGALGAGEYRVASYMDRPRLHARVQFRDPVTGPIYAGVGRHYGLGMFAAVP